MENFDQVQQKLDKAGIKYQVVTVDSQGTSVDDYVKAIGIKYREGISTLIYKYAGNKFVAVLRRDDRNIDMNKLRKALGIDDVKFASDEELNKIGFEHGLVSPVLLPEKKLDRILVEEKVIETNSIICGIAKIGFSLRINSKDLLEVVGEYQVLDLTVANTNRQDEKIDSGSTIKRILTGDRPTGPLHIGHYVGSLQKRVEMQHEYDTFIMLADVQALTDNYDNPDKVRQNILQVYRDYYAVGIDLDKVHVFIQSMIPEIAELTVFFANLVTHSEVLRNPTVKTEIDQKGFGESVPFGFVSYPVSQAADILFCKANAVPVGEDQKPMIELARKIAKRFNTIYKKEVFPQPEAHLGKIKRLCGTDGNAKMGKSLGNTINLNATTEEVRKQVMGMFTDPNRLRATDPGKVEGNPVFIYHDVFNPNTSEVDDLKARYREGKVGDVEVKEKLFAAMENFLAPMRERRAEIDKKSDKELMIDLLSSTSYVQKVAKETMAEVREVMKIDYK